MKRPSSTQIAALAKALTQVYGTDIPDFDRAYTGLYTPFRRLVVDLARTQGQSAQGDVYDSIGGDFIYVDPDQSTLNPAIGSVTIELNDHTNTDVAPMTANPGFAEHAVFTSIKLRYTNQPGKRLVLMYSTGYSVIPSFAALTSIANTVTVAGANDDAAVDAGQAFMSELQVPTAAANLSHFQLKNPLASGKTVYLDAFRIGTPVAGLRTFFLQSYDTDLTNVVPATATNKRLGGAAPVARISWQINAALLGTTYGKIQPLNGQDMIVRHVFQPAIRLDPGKGFVWANGLANDNFEIFPEWREK